MPETTSLAEEFPKQQQRVRELIAEYRSLPGGVGQFGAILMEDTLRRADRAVMEGDVVAMLRIYQEMVECK